MHPNLITIPLIFQRTGTNFELRSGCGLSGKGPKRNIMCTIAALGVEKKEVEVGVGFGQTLVFPLNQDSIFDITHNKCSDDN